MATLTTLGQPAKTQAKAPRSPAASLAPQVPEAQHGGGVAHAAFQPADVLRFQRIIGNRSVQHLLRASHQAGVVQRQPNAIHSPAQDIRRPETFPTYEGWLEAFYSSFLATPELQEQHTFRAGDTARTGVRTPEGQETPSQPTQHWVLGQRAPSQGEAPTPVGERRADHFIDHPTNDWVNDHLPPRLRETAYELPSDCADMAVILRHVWVASHGRTETYRGWTIGFHPGGRAREQARVRGVIVGEGSLYSGNVSRMVNPYSDSSGHPLRSFARLEPMLHPGDILVWEHHQNDPTVRSGGHTQTIAHIDRNADGHITQMTLLQGNQPIGRAQAAEIREQEADEGRRAPGEMELRHAPGRRIEMATMESDRRAGDLVVPGDFDDMPEPRRGHSAEPSQDVWTWMDGHTRLVVAGPPASARRPAARRERRQAPAVRHLSDWTPALASATSRALIGRFEAALLEARAMLEGGVSAGQATVSDEEASALGQAAGESVWRMARSAARYEGRSSGRQRQALGDQSHFQVLQQMLAMLDAVRAAGLNERVRAIFGLIRQALVAGARGATTLTFERSGVGHRRVIRILLTGFDPFNTAPGQSGQPPREGEWNPSGAAVMALDGTRIDIGRRATVAVEGMVLPVSFADFGEGMVERFVRPHVNNVDAVITVSMAPSIAPGEPVRLERYAVNVHQLDNGEMQPISDVGPAIIQAQAPVEAIAAETERGARRRERRTEPAIPRPAIGTDLTFRFESEATANAVRRLLGLPVQSSSPDLANPFADEVVISDPAMGQVAPTIQRLSRGGGLWVSFQLQGQTFQAEITRGPGGSFLSNEVSYRVLDMVRGQSPLSFHVHTQRGGAQESVAPTDVNTPEARQALRTATQVRTTLIATLRQMLRAVANRIVE